ncbi:amidohydrolase [Streptomyces capparidis]
MSDTPTDTPATGSRPRTVLLRGGTIHSPADPFATAMVVQGDRIAWLGSEGAAAAHAGSVDEVVELDGALVTPAFTDAHVHTTATGLALTGLDLTGSPSLADALERLAAHAAAHPHHRVVLGHGWDSARWPEHRAPTREEIAAAAPGRAVYLTRTDMHSAAVSPALLDAVPGIADLDGHQGDGTLTRDAHHAARRAAHAAVTPAQRRDAQRAALRRAASLGIAAVHECAGPDISSEDDLADLLALAAHEPGPLVFGYWAQALAPDDADGAARVRELGAVGAAGDLFVDGSLGSRTAHLCEPYADAAGHRGTAFLDAEAVAGHLLACTRAGLQAGFHAIGDAAVESVVAGARRVAEQVGLARLRAARHRVEHAEMLGPGAVAAFAELGLIASVQPAFDAAWGGEDGMYAERLGGERARTLNPYAALLRAGVPLAFGSDAPVTPLDPWGTVRAAVFHRTPEHRISARAAFTAHTRGGWRALGHDDTGVLVPGAPAHYAVWAADDLLVQAPDERVAGWSTDPRSGTPGLPDVSPGAELPHCLRTVVAGRVVHMTPNG